MTRENGSTWRKSFPSVTMFTRNLTWTYLGSKPGLNGEMPATNRVIRKAIRLTKNILKDPVRTAQ